MIPKEEARQINQALGIGNRKRYVIYPDADSHWHLAVSETDSAVPILGKMNDLSTSIQQRMKNIINVSDSIEQGNIIIGKIDSELYKERIVNIVKELINRKKLRCFYVTFNRPSATLLKLFKKKRIKTNNIHFFDAITRLSVNADSDKGFCFVDSPKHLGYLLVFIKRHLENTKNQKSFLIVDALPNILDCNTTEETVSFIQALTNKLRLDNIGGMLLDVGSVQEHASPSKFKKFADFSFII
jgi:hypothetical protein